MTSASEYDSPLPLPCAGFEHYMFTDEWSSHPMVSYLEVELTGHLHLDALRVALKEAYGRHPLLSARVERRWVGGTWWVEGEVPELQLLERGAADLPELDAEYIDLKHEVGSRVYLHDRGESSTIYLFVHHACSDALGMLTFLADWLNAYGCIRHESLSELALQPVDWTLLRRRESLRGERCPFSLATRLKRFTSILRTSKPFPLAIAPAAKNDFQRDTSEASRPGHCEYRFSPTEFQQLKAFTQQQGMTLNDLLTTAMLQAVVVWQQRHGQSSGDDLIRLIVPVSRRTERDRALSAANKIGYKFVSRSIGDVQRGVLQDVHEELEFVRRRRMGMISLLKVVQWMRRLRVTRMMLPRDRCFATAVFSNIGDVGRLFADRLPLKDGHWNVAGLTVTRLRCAPPRRPFTHTTVVAIGYGNTVTLCSRGDGRGLNATQTQEFLDLLGEEARALAGIASTANAEADASRPVDTRERS